MGCFPTILRWETPLENNSLQVPVVVDNVLAHEPLELL